MKTSTILLLIAGGGAIYFLTRKPAAKAITTTEKPKELPAEKVPPIAKPGKLVDKGFTYDCKKLNVISVDKMHDYVKANSIIIGNKLGLTNTKLLANLTLPIFADAVISSINKSCLKNPELMKGEEKANQIALVTYYFAGIFDNIMEKENISQNEKTQLEQLYYQKLKEYYQITDEDTQKFIEIFTKLIPFKESYDFDCNSFTIKNEKVFDAHVGFILVEGFAKEGFSGDNKNSIFDISLFNILKFTINKLSAKCTLENISDEVFIAIAATVIYTFKALIKELFPDDVDAVFNAEEQIAKLYEDTGTSQEGIQEIEELVGKLNLNPEFEEPLQTI